MSPSRSAFGRHWRSATPVDRAVAVGVGLLALGVVPALPAQLSHQVVFDALGAAGLPLLVLLAAGRGGADRIVVTAARAALAFVVVGLVSALLSANTAIALFGLYVQQTGWLFMLGVAGAWAIGTRLSPNGRSLLETTLIVVSVACSLVAVAQELWGASAYDTFEGRPTGWLGNPVFLGELLAAGLVLVAPRFRSEPRRWWFALGAVGLGIGICGQRLPVIAAAFIIVVEIWTSWRASRGAPAATEPGGFGRRLSESDRPARRHGLIFGVVTVVSVVVGTAVDSVRGLGVVSYTLNSSAEGTYGDRFHGWIAALHGFSHQPLFGWGPGLFEAATSRYFSASFFVQSNGGFFADAHNFVVEYLATTGIAGVVCLVIWLALHVRAARRSMLAFGAVILGLGLLEPQNGVITSLAFLALGAALRAGADERSPDAGEDRAMGDSRRWLTVATVVVALLGLAGGSTVFAGELLLRGVTTTSVAYAGPGPAETDGRRADQLLPFWSDPAVALSAVHSYLAISGKKREEELTVQLARTAADRQPFEAELWVALASDASTYGDVATVRSAVGRGLDDVPVDYLAMNVEALTDLTNHDRAGATYWFGRSLEIDAHQPRIGLVLHGGCRNIVFAWRTGQCIRS